MTNHEARRNDEIRMTMGVLRALLLHLDIRASFVIRHSCFVIPVISTHSRAAPRLSSSRADCRSVFPSPREGEALPWFCATSAPVPIHRDDKATLRVS